MRFNVIFLVAIVGAIGSCSALYIPEIPEPVSVAEALVVGLQAIGEAKQDLVQGIRNTRNTTIGVLNGIAPGKEATLNTIRDGKLALINGIYNTTLQAVESVQAIDKGAIIDTLVDKLNSIGISIQSVIDHVQYRPSASGAENNGNDGPILVDFQTGAAFNPVPCEHNPQALPLIHNEPTSTGSQPNSPENLVLPNKTASF